MRRDGIEMYGLEEAPKPRQVVEAHVSVRVTAAYGLRMHRPVRFIFYSFAVFSLLFYCRCQLSPRLGQCLKRCRKPGPLARHFLALVRVFAVLVGGFHGNVPSPTERVGMYRTCWHGSKFPWGLLQIVGN